MRRKHGSGIVMLVYVSLVFAAIGVLLGGQWSLLWESLRVGNGHLSFRVQRVPWGNHEPALYVGALAVFWLVVALRGRAAVPYREVRSGLSVT